jgi:acyl-CoA synthetase (AMP-forming)/AMP-acid ligase II
MLYERWRQVAAEHPGEMALRDLASGTQWTFLELAAAAERLAAGLGPIVFPQGTTAVFVLEVLRAWKAGQIVCPLDTAQEPFHVPAPPPDTVHLKTTSATTSAPRLVAFTAAQLMADAENIVQTMGLRPDWPNLGAISLAHSYGFSNLVTPLLLHGVPLILVSSGLPEALRAAARACSTITLPAVPALWRAWHEAEAIPQNVRLAISAGAPLPLPLELSIFARSGLKLHNFYGATECGGITFDATPTPRRDAACVGSPMRNVSLSVTEDDSLEVRSGAVGQTYWPEPSPNLGDGRYRTSDCAEIRHGQVFLRGRLSDQINVAGRKVAPETIERVLALHTQVRDCLVFGVPSEEAGRAESIVACVAAHATVTGDELKQFLLPQLPAWQVPREWWFVDSLCANQRGKLSRYEWRKRYLERLLDPSPRNGPKPS